MSEEISRHYNMEDEVMITRAQVQQGLLNTDLALFTGKFPWIVQAFSDSYRADCTTADAFPEDDTVMSDLQVLTDDVNSSVAEGIVALQSLFLYAKIAYPDNTAKQRVFGQDRLEKARNDQEKMENLLEHANAEANKVPYKTDLIAKGYLQPQIDGLLTISNNINTKNILQESAKRNRPVTTQDRIKVYNIVYDRMALVYLCAQEVFRGNAAKIEQYRAYPPAGPDNTTATVHIVNGSNDPMPDLSVRILALPESITDIGGMAGPFDFGSSPPDFVDVIVSGASIHPSPQTFNKPVNEGEANSFEITVTV